MTSREELERWRYNLVPDHLIGELLSKRWADNAIPFLAMVATIVGFGSGIPGLFPPPAPLRASPRRLAGSSLVFPGPTVVILAGGIDLSVSSIFALAAFAAVSSV